jgi:putative peptide zinc metalloprotease protein
VTDDVDEAPTGALDVYALLAGRLDVMAAHPCPREGLRSAQRDDGLVLNDPQRGTYALLEPEDAWLWQRMDGSRTVGDLLVAFFQEFHVLAPARLLNLVATLKARGMLTDEPVDVWTALAARLGSGRVRRLRTAVGIVTGREHLKLRRADPFFAWLARVAGRVVYTPAVRWLCLAIAAVGGATFLYEVVSGSYSATPTAVPVWGVVLLVYGIQLAITAAHELAHGVECKHRGCRVNAFGVTLFYGIPCLFVDTTDVWMADRKGRILTSWAGPYAELIISGTLAVTVLLVGPPWQMLLFQVVFLLNFTAIFNLLPFVEMDGYYILVDVLGIPRLRARSLAFLRRGLVQRWR